MTALGVRRANAALFQWVQVPADTFGGDENVRGQVRQFIASALGRLAREIHGTVVLCAHPSRSGLDSGRRKVCSWR